MRDFFIRSFEVIVSVVVVLMAVAVVIVGLMAIFNGQFLQGLGILVGGAVYVLFLGGFMFLGLGIYQNTKRAADALEARRP